MTKFTKFIRNIPWKEVLVCVLLGAIAIGAVVGIGAALTTKTKTVSSLEFTRGAIDANGIYTESKTSIYTKDMIECQGLEITPDFEATGTYQVFYYDVNKLFLGASPVLNASTGGAYKKGQDFPYAKYCRIMITPETPKDEDGYVVEDYTIKFYEVIGIADDFTITVNKEQKTVKEENLFDVSNKELNCHYQVVDGYASFDNKDGTNAVTVHLNGSVDYLKLEYDNSPGTYSYLFVSSDNRVISNGTFNNDTLSYSLKVPDNAVLLVINYGDHALPAIYRAG